ncbi:MAG: sugar transferase [Alphaproteobacteria bacterium]|nr:sugar transferase [Alphaproteobacteria bacterium]
MKVVFDFFCAFIGLVILSPIILLCAILIWLQDYHSPFFLGERVGKNGRLFKMIKLRSMVKAADKAGIDSTSSQDPRITQIGRFVRRYKLDEISQLFNVVKGEMSLVGPRPNVKRETDLYSKEEVHLLDVCPGITDIASIVFADEGEILQNHDDPDIAYNQLIRPWKSQLGLFYIKHQSFALDIKIIYLTVLCIVSRSRALEKVALLLKKLKAPEELIQISLRKNPLRPTPPPGFDSIVTSRQLSPS